MSLSVIVGSISNILSTLIGGLIAYYVAQSKLKTQREYSIEDWYSKSLLLADQSSRIRPDDYSSDKELQVTSGKAQSLATQIDQHVAEAPGAVNRDVTQKLDQLGRNCYLLSYLTPKDSQAFRDAVNDVTSTASNLEDEVNRVS